MYKKILALGLGLTLAACSSTKPRPVIVYPLTPPVISQQQERPEPVVPAAPRPQVLEWTVGSTDYAVDFSNKDRDFYQIVSREKNLVTTTLIEDHKKDGSINFDDVVQYEVVGLDYKIHSQLTIRILNVTKETKDGKEMKIIDFKDPKYQKFITGAENAIKKVRAEYEKQVGPAPQPPKKKKTLQEQLDSYYRSSFPN